MSLAGVGRPACPQTCRPRHSPSSLRTSGPAANQARQSRQPTAQGTATVLRRCRTPMPAPTALLQTRSSTGATAPQPPLQPQLGTVQPVQPPAGLTQAPAPQQGTVLRLATAAALQRAATDSQRSSSPSSRRLCRPLQLCLLLLREGTVHPPATAPARLQGATGSSHMAATGSRRSRRSRSTSPTRQGLCRLLRWVCTTVWWCCLLQACCWIMWFLFCLAAKVRLVLV